ncbi:TPA: hypothetical protein ACKO2U_003731 [Clostridioides difficile]|uniref:hypothetical protein n=1 Tax=Clostridioides difficile TaxID=1496 RepID=UPI0025503B28|nr:hypothetical protein [Clostridioides difficile]MDL0274256.1 hypothetical protein [Clostridioides difficile]MDL0285821.1 hypothetical protein [Clostridioides difficile]
MKNNTSDSRVKYFCKCPYCKFDNEVEVKKGLKPKICCICTKEVEYEKLEQQSALENTEIKGVCNQMKIILEFENIEEYEEFLKIKDKATIELELQKLPLKKRKHNN